MPQSQRVSQSNSQMSPIIRAARPPYMRHIISMKIRRLSGFSSFMLASHLHLMKYLPPQDYTTPPKLFSWPNMAIIPKVTKGNGTPSKGVFVSRDKRKDAVPAHIEGYGRTKSYENRTN